MTSDRFHRVAENTIFDQQQNLPTQSTPEGQDLDLETSGLTA